MSGTSFERRLGLSSVIGISLGAMLGSGLFVLPGIAVAQTGPSIWLAYLVAGLCVLPTALSKAELATAMPESGGTYVYVDRTLGPLASTIGGLGLWLSLLLKSAFALVGFGAYLSVLTHAPVLRVGLGLLAFIIALNLFGVSKVAKAQVQIVGISLIGLLVLTIWGGVQFEPAYVEDAFPAGAWGFLQTVSLVYISYAGVTKVAAIAEEVKDPGRNLPLGILVSLGVVTLVYTAVTFVLAGNVPASELAGDMRPIHTLAERLGGAPLGIMAALLGILTMTSMANAGLLAASRFPFAMGRDRLLPAAFARVNERFKTPGVSIFATGALMALAVSFLEVKAMAKLASSLMIVSFMVENLSLIILREAGTRWYKPKYRAPFYPVVQILGILIGIGLLAMLGWTGLGALVAVLLAGGALYFLFGRNRTRRRGVVGLMGRRPEVFHSSHEGEEMHVGETPVVVAMTGRERSADMLVEVGCALAGSDAVAAVHMSEVPEQLKLDDLDRVEAAEVNALRRRIESMAKRCGRDVRFDAIATRDLGRCKHALSQRAGTNWLVVEWRPRTSSSLLPVAPLGWLVEHLGCNRALFRDAGVRSFEEILVLVEPGPHDALVISVADHLADTFGARLTLLRCVPASASKIELQAAADYADELASLCHGDIDRRALQVEDEVEDVVQLSGSYDLLVMGAPPDRRLRDFFRGSMHERLTRAATCSVLQLKAPRHGSHEVVARTVPRLEALDEPVLTEVLEEHCLVPQLPPMSKEELFLRFAQSFAAVLPDVTVERIEEALWTREHTQNTAIGDGMALPHATVAEADRAYLGIFTTAEPLDYKAPDGTPADVFFVTLGPPSERNTHLRILSNLARIVLEGPVLANLRAARSASELRAALGGAPREDRQGV